ncbi:MAG: hypothetical protein JXA28_03135 [Bacteroidetes bacterium]|nr:hypothetical protein [Bacteroidota bacterium]
MSDFFRHGIRTALWVLSLLLMGGCTDNPFESTPAIESSKRKVHGVVRLSDTQDHSGVYVWLQGFEIATTTDHDGSFTITLPPPEAQGVTGGVNGVYRMYAFLGNYRLVSVRAAVRDGTFAFPSDEIRENGEIREPLFMQQLFSITTSLSRNRIEADSPRTITIQVVLQSDSPPAEVYFPRMLAGIEGPVLLHNTQTGEVDIYPTVVTGVEIQDYVQVGSVPYIRSLLLIIPKYRLKAGIYEIIPYLIPQGQQIPLPLLKSLGDDVSGLNESYVLYPFRREGGILTVQPN